MYIVENMFRIERHLLRTNWGFSDCDYNTMTPPIGGFLTTNVYLGVDMITTNCMNTAGHVWMVIDNTKYILLHVKVGLQL